MELGSDSTQKIRSENVITLTRMGLSETLSRKRKCLDYTYLFLEKEACTKLEKSRFYPKLAEIEVLDAEKLSLELLCPLSQIRSTYIERIDFRRYTKESTHAGEVIFAINETLYTTSTEHIKPFSIENKEITSLDQSIMFGDYQSITFQQIQHYQ